MSYPSLRDWLFSVKTFAASMIALYLALIFQLPRPYWAMASVYIVSNPFVGATRSKAHHRVFGTVLGAVAAVIIVPPFVETPMLFSAIVAIWTGTLVYLGISDRTARSYVYMLAGVTMPLIALPTVFDPSTVFDLAVSRTEEITLGIICANVVGSAILPSPLAPTLVDRTDAWFREAAFYGIETLSGRPSWKVLSGSRQRLSSTVNDLEILLSQLRYDHADTKVVERAAELRRRMTFYLPIASSLADPLFALLKDLRSRPPGFDKLLSDIAEWLDKSRANQGDHSENSTRRIAESLHVRIGSFKPPAGSLKSWDSALLANTLWRLDHFIEIWQDCCTLRLLIGQGSGDWRPRFRHWRIGGTKRYFDRGLMLFSCAVPVSAILIACSLWINSGWHDGANAVTLAAVACGFFAALDEPAPAVSRFIVATVVSIVLAGFYLFLVLPTVHDFPMLVLLFAGPFILVGTMMPRPHLNMVTMLVAVNTASFISIQSAYDADVLAFLNSNIAGLSGLLFAYVWTRITRPFGAELAANRLLRSSWKDVVLSATSTTLSNQRDLASRMVDRLQQLIPRLDASDDPRHPSVESLRDLRIAVNALDLRRACSKHGGDLCMDIDRVLLGITDHYVKCAEAGERRMAPRSLLQDIDVAFHRVALSSDPQPSTAARIAQMPARRQSDIVHALVGLRLSLFPASAGNSDLGDPSPSLL